MSRSLYQRCFLISCLHCMYSLQCVVSGSVSGDESDSRRHEYMGVAFYLYPIFDVLPHFVLVGINDEATEFEGYRLKSDPDALQRESVIYPKGAEETTDAFYARLEALKVTRISHLLPQSVAEDDAAFRKRLSTSKRALHVVSPRSKKERTEEFDFRMEVAAFAQASIEPKGDDEPDEFFHARIESAKRATVWIVPKATRGQEETLALFKARCLASEIAQVTILPYGSVSETADDFALRLEAAKGASVGIVGKDINESDDQFKARLDASKAPGIGGMILCKDQVSKESDAEFAERLQAARIAPALLLRKGENESLAMWSKRFAAAKEAKRVIRPRQECETESQFYARLEAVRSARGYIEARCRPWCDEEEDEKRFEARLEVAKVAPAQVIESTKKEEEADFADRMKAAEKANSIIFPRLSYETKEEFLKRLKVSETSPVFIPPKGVYEDGDSFAARLDAIKPGHKYRIEPRGESETFDIFKERLQAAMESDCYIMAFRSPGFGTETLPEFRARLDASISMPSLGGVDSGWFGVLLIGVLVVVLIAFLACYLRAPRKSPKKMPLATEGTEMELSSVDASQHKC